MTTMAKNDATITDGSPIPTWNPGGDVKLLRAEDRQEARGGAADLAASLLARARALISRARDRSGA